MAEQASEKITLQYPVNINGMQYPAGIPIDVPKEIAAQAKELSDNRLKQELKRMDGEQPQNIFLGHQG